MDPGTGNLRAVISPDVAAAVDRLEYEKVIAPAQARLFGRVAQGDLVSLSPALHALLYLGTAALTTGVGLLFRTEIANLGPITIALAVALASGGCLTWVARKSPGFTASEARSPHFAFDYALVLGALLAAADLAFVESRFSPLGAEWAFHLLVVALFYAALAFRFDSRTMFGLALTSFAAWRGVSVANSGSSLIGFFDETVVVRLNALACGLLFVFLGRVLVQRRFKAHFEPTAVHLGWLLILQSIAWGLWDGPTAVQHRLALMATGAGLAWMAWRGGRFVLFVFGVLAAYFAFMVMAADILDDATPVLLLTSISAISLVFGLAAIHRRFPREAEEE